MSGWQNASLGVWHREARGLRLVVVRDSRRWAEKLWRWAVTRKGEHVMPYVMHPTDEPLPLQSAMLLAREAARFIARDDFAFWDGEGSARAGAGQ